MDGFGMRLAYVRKEKKLSQNDMAKRIGVSRPTVTQWESGAKIPSASSLDKICDLLDVSIDWLMGKIESAEPISKNEQKLIDDADLPLVELLKKYNFGDISEAEILDALAYIKTKRLMNEQK